MSFSPEPDDKDYEKDIIPLKKFKKTEANDGIPSLNKNVFEPPPQLIDGKPKDPRLKSDSDLNTSFNHEPSDGIKPNENDGMNKVWNEVFTVESVKDLGKLTINVNGMDVFRSQLRRPLKIGDYSLRINAKTQEREFLNDSSELKYLHAPPANSAISFDVCHGYDPSVNWGEAQDVGLDELLRWICLNRKKFMAQGETAIPNDLHTDFVTYRGTITKIMLSPYERSEKWMICATKFRNTIYLCQFNGDEKFPQPDDFFNRLSFSGYRFEKYLCSHIEDVPPDPNYVDVHNNNQYCCVMRSRVSDQHSSHSFVCGAEVDCQIPKFKEVPGTLSNFIEIKSTRKIKTQSQYDSFIKYKLIKWWAQSYLVGVPKVYVGYRNDKFQIQETELLSIEKFPELGQHYWSANVCLNFLNQFLSFVKSNVTIDDPNVVYQFEFEPKEHEISCKRLTEPGHYQIIPEWYVKEFT